MLAISERNVERVKELLETGADANYYDDGVFNNPDIQPSTPLKSVIFYISDALLNDEDLQNHYDIAEMLLKAGANTEAAMELAEIRYGKYDPSASSSPFTDILHLVAQTS